jgi:AraC-like DNA-binding protein
VRKLLAQNPAKVVLRCACHRRGAAFGWLAPRILPPGVDPGSFSESTRRALAYMERFYMMPVELKNVARRAGLSLYHFCLVFHRETGMTPMKYVNCYRIEQAKTLLATTTKPVRQIAQMVRRMPVPITSTRCTSLEAIFLPCDSARTARLWGSLCLKHSPRMQHNHFK